ncbi:tryptophan ABC transporter substrate-binding protein [Jeotgalibaca caeni]|uniref:tryptophan ABC transporter substrate-binding protein n=1 Tax=Jeotgalibaca caeni TaxID=3028623 RepID=UPI00237D87C2|nr:tryptophan ABC transporter substrate-binding protein [Jeotgalibaca caeni]MDE1548794.1 tryptophan ABC transporter substrate-binding protein [Jeotgalibaca caeni]
MKKKLSSFVILLSTLFLTSCGSSDAESMSSTAGTDELPYIGILQLTSHPALDAISEGIIDELADAGYVDGETATIDLQNAQGDQSNMQTITERFITNKADVMVGIATPAAQALANATTEIPIILGAITDPVAANLVDSLETPGRNITGVSDQIPIDQQFELMLQLVPDLETVGLLYSSSEANSLSSAEEAEKIAHALGLSTISKTVNSANDLAQVAESLAKDVDAIWVPTDNTIATSTQTLIAATDARGIPVFPSVDTMVTEGGLATVGLNQYAIGTQTGQVTVDILEGADPATYPIQFPNEIETILNQEKASQLNITIPEDLQADIE